MAKTLVGTVSSASPDKTIVISVNTRKTHPIYKKQYTVTSKFMAHDEENACKVGDRVSIVETRPISARKRFKLDKIIERASLTKDDLKALDTETEENAPKQKETTKESVEEKNPPKPKKAEKAEKPQKAADDKEKA